MPDPPVPLDKCRTGQDVALAQSGPPAVQIGIPRESCTVETYDERIGLLGTVRGWHVEAVAVPMISDPNRQTRLDADRLWGVGLLGPNCRLDRVETGPGVPENCFHQLAGSLAIVRRQIIADQLRKGPTLRGGSSLRHETLDAGRLRYHRYRPGGNGDGQDQPKAPLQKAQGSIEARGSAHPAHPFLPTGPAPPP